MYFGCSEENGSSKQRAGCRETPNSDSDHAFECTEYDPCTDQYLCEAMTSTTTVGVRCGSDPSDSQSCSNPSNDSVYRCTKFSGPVSFVYRECVELATLGIFANCERVLRDGDIPTAEDDPEVVSAESVVCSPDSESLNAGYFACGIDSNTSKVYGCIQPETRVFSGCVWGTLNDGAYPLYSEPNYEAKCDMEAHDYAYLCYVTGPSSNPKVAGCTYLDTTLLTGCTTTAPPDDMLLATASENCDGSGEDSRYFCYVSGPKDSLVVSGCLTAAEATAAEPPSIPIDLGKE